MNQNRRILRATACCMAAVMALGSAPVKAETSMPIAGAPAMMSIAVEDAMNATFETASAGISLNLADIVSAPASDEAAEPKSEYADIAIAQVDNYVNVRDAAGEEGNVVGKLYNNSAATVEATEGDWYKITSGNVTGYVKSEFVVRDNEELAKQVSRRVATVHTETLFVRTEPTTESDVLGMVPDLEELTVTDESVDGWTKVSIEEGEGYVSNDYVNKSIEFVTAESKEEEEARLAKEEADRKAAQAAARRAAEKSNSSGGGQVMYASGNGSEMGRAVANYALQFVGNPYVYGGTSLTNGADCSGFVMSVYANFGVSLPHSSAADRNVGAAVNGLANAQPGDLVCYSGHVALYIGNGQIVHASTSKTGIIVSNASYRTPLSVRRIF